MRIVDAEEKAQEIRTLNREIVKDHNLSDEKR